MIIVGEWIHRHHLYCPLPFVVAESYGMYRFALCDGFAFQVMIGSIQIRHEYPLLVHADNTSTEAPIAVRMKVSIALADVTVEKWIQVDGKVFLERADLNACLAHQPMKCFLIGIGADEHSSLVEGFFHDGFVVIAIAGG